MSVAFNSKSSEMRYSGLEDDVWFKNQRRCINSERWVRPAGVCLILMVLSLLIIILIFMAQSTRTNSAQSITQVQTSEDYECLNLTFQWIQLQNKYQSLDKEKDALKAERDIISVDRDCLRAERDALKPERDALIHELDQTRESNKNMTEEMEVLRTRYGNLLKNMQDASNGTGKVCPDQWVKFENSCYYISKQSKRWLTSKRECELQNAYLVIINSKQENDFVSRFYETIWIGLSDRAKEGKWKWVNDADLEDATYWASGEPNNADSNEDCAELLRDSKEWNDVPCGHSLSFICEM